MSNGASPNSAFALTPARRRGSGVWLWLAALCVVLGLVTSVGMAWCLTYRASYAAPRTSPSRPIDGYLAWSYADMPGMDPHWSLRRTEWPGVDSNRFDLGYPTCLVEIGNDDADRYQRFTRDAADQRAIARHTPLLITKQGQGVEFVVVLAGWPWRCVSGEDAYSANDHLAYRAFEATLLKAHPDLASVITPILDEPPTRFNLEPCYDAIVVGGVLIPIRPIWPGLLADTAVFGGAWVFVIFTPLGARRWLRARRGGCPKCGYSREGLNPDAVCPECGHGA